MKRFFPLLPLLLLPALPAHADLILGAQVSKQYLDLRYSDMLGSTEDSADTRAGLGLIVGFGQPGGGSRMTAEWSGYEIGDEAELNLLNFSYSYFFPALSSSSALKLRPFAGGELGFGWLDVAAQSLYREGDDSGLLFGARVGLNLAISERAEIELGARYSVVNLDAALSGKLPGAGVAHYEVENNKGWWLGFNIGL